MSSSHFSCKQFMKHVDPKTDPSAPAKNNIYADAIANKNQPDTKRLGGFPEQTMPEHERRKIETLRVRGGKFSSMSALDRHKHLVNNYMLYYGKGAKDVFKRDSSKHKRDIDVVRENHRFLWEDEEGEEINSKDLKWEQRVAKKYWDKLFTEYAICDLTYYKKNRIAFRWRIEKEVVAGKGQFICAQKKVCSSREGLRTWEVNFSYVEDEKKKFALVKVRLCATCSAKLNSNKKYLEVRKEQNRLALLREREHRVDAQREKLHNAKRRRELADKASVNNGNSSGGEDSVGGKKTRLTDKEQKEKQALDEAHLGEEVESGDIWKAPADLDEEKTKEQEFDEYFEDLFL